MIPMPATKRVQQVEAACRELILAGRPGDRLPGETELAAQLSTSRVTVREALSRLWHAGLVVRRWGVGTFIADASRLPSAGSIYLGMEHVGSLPQRLADAGHEVGLSHFAVSRSQWPDWAGLADAYESPWRIERCMTIDGTPAILLHDYLPTEVRGSEVPEPHRLADIRNDLPGMLRSAGIRIVKDEATLHGVSLSSEQAHHLRLPAGTATLHARQRSLSEHGDVVACAEAYYRTDTFTTTLVRTVSD
ncbi:GntR family transcriptional regulator [Terrabacter sp. GCM10028922]|uniref:GntR family transcriptional regulator n=1 Tax=Terrabacter sp. GCM10028922 TaxID=3273428 RepID=UPI0036244AB4